VKTLTANTISAAAAETGVEPILILKVEWPIGTKYYATKTLTLGSLSCIGIIKQFSGPDITEKASTVGSVSLGSFTIVDDGSNDPELYRLYKQVDIFNVPATVYHHFEGNSEADLLILFSGFLTTPFTWTERTRELSLSILSPINNKPFGFSIKQRTPDITNPGIIGQVWPMVFGAAAFVQGIPLQMQNKAKGKTFIEQGYTRIIKVEDLYEGFRYRLENPTWSTMIETTDDEGFDSGDVLIDGVRCKGTFSNHEYMITAFNVPMHTNISVRDKTPDSESYHKQRQIYIDNTSDSFVGKWLRVRVYVPDLFAVNPQYWSMQNFQVVEQFVLNNQTVLVVDAPCVLRSGRVMLIQANSLITEVTAWPSITWDWPANAKDIDQKVRKFSTTAPDIIPFDNTEIDHLVNATGFSTVSSVWARRTKSNLEMVPASYYNIRNINEPNTGRAVTLVTLNQPLSAYVDEGWDDTIYAIVASNLSANPAEIIRYAITNYSDLTADTTTFDAVALLVAKYPIHFAVLSEEDVIAFIERIAWQARCALFIDNDVVRISYISTEPSAVLTITDDDVLDENLVITCTERDDLVTEFTAKWRSTANQSKDYEYIIENPINNLTLESEYSFNHAVRSLVVKSANFWAYRKSKCWKIVELETYFSTLGLEYYDCVQLNLSYCDQFMFPNTKAIVIGKSYQQDRIRLKLLLPIPVGSNLVDSGFWVSDAGDPAAPAFPYVIPAMDYKVPTENDDLESSDVVPYSDVTSGPSTGTTDQPETVNSTPATKDTPLTPTEAVIVTHVQQATFRYAMVTGFNTGSALQKSHLVKVKLLSFKQAGGQQFPADADYRDYFIVQETEYDAVLPFYEQSPTAETGTGFTFKRINGMYYNYFPYIIQDTLYCIRTRTNSATLSAATAIYQDRLTPLAIGDIVKVRVGHTGAFNQASVSVPGAAISLELESRYKEISSPRMFQVVFGSTVGGVTLEGVPLLSDTVWAKAAFGVSAPFMYPSKIKLSLDVHVSALVHPGIVATGGGNPVFVSLYYVARYNLLDKTVNYYVWDSRDTDLPTVNQSASTAVLAEAIFKYDSTTNAYWPYDIRHYHSAPVQLYKGTETFVGSIVSYVSDNDYTVAIKDDNDGTTNVAVEMFPSPTTELAAGTKVVVVKIGSQYHGFYATNEAYLGTVTAILSPTTYTVNITNGPATLAVTVNCLGGTLLVAEQLIVLRVGGSYYGQGYYHP
jgi:hypothetical protein